MSTPRRRFHDSHDHLSGFAFRTRFDKSQFADLLTDEPAPLGGDSAPNPARLLAAACRHLPDSEPALSVFRKPSFRRSTSAPK